MDSLKNEIQLQASLSASAGRNELRAFSAGKPNGLQAELLDNVKFALAAERLDCRPIRGVDLPLKSNATTALLVEVEQLDRLETVNLQPPPLRLTDEDKIFAMLLPSQLSAPSTFFLEETDLDVTFEQKHTKAPPTIAQLVRDDYVSHVLEDKIEQDISEKERRATLECMLKVMRHNEKQIRDQLTHIETEQKQY